MIDDMAAFTGLFGGTADYAPQLGDVVNVWMDVQDATNLGRPGPVFDPVFAPGLGRYAEGRVVAAELGSKGVTPAQGDTITQDGITWRIEEIRTEGNMLVLALSADQRWGRNG